MQGKISYFLCSLFLLCSLATHGQEIQLGTSLPDTLMASLDLQPNKEIGTNFPTISSQSSISYQSVSPVFLPAFARENPTGYTYLCRLELKIEKELPLGLWLDIGDESTVGNPSNANANVRFRFKLK